MLKDRKDQKVFFSSYYTHITKAIIKASNLIIGVLLLFGGCSSDLEDVTHLEKSSSSSTISSRDCIESLSFDTKVTTFAKFDVPTEELTVGERNLSLPKVNHRSHFICKRSDGSVVSEVVNNPNLETHTDYPDYTLGAPRKIEWRSVNNDGFITVYNAEGSEITSYAAEVPFNDNADIFASYHYQLQDQSIYEVIIAALGDQMQINELNDHLLEIMTTTAKGVSKFYIDKRYQRHVATENYSTDGVLLDRTSYLYNEDNGVVTLENKIFEAFKKSMDSERIMTMVKLTSYTYN